jgi:hypothetical protein
MASVIDQIIAIIPAQCYCTDIINSLLSEYHTQCITINMTIPQQIRCCKEIKNVLEANIIGLCFLIQNETWIDVFQESYVGKNEIPFIASLTIILIFNLAYLKIRRNVISFLMFLRQITMIVYCSKLSHITF